MGFFDPELLDPVVHCFARCYLCKRLIAIKEGDDGLLNVGERKCPHCGVFLEEDQVIRSFSENIVNTFAITSANKLVSFDPAVIPYVLAGLLVTYMEFPTWIQLINTLIYHFPIVLLLRWLHRYWYLVRFADEEYLGAVTAVKQSLLLWSFTNLFSWALLLL